METKSKLNWSLFEPLFGTWASKIKPFFDSGGFDNIYMELKKLSQRGKKIFPESKNTFRAFIECPIDELKCVICGISPYHSIKNGIIIADGLALSCSNTKYLQPTLEQWYSACELELHKGLCVPCIKNTDLKFLANQGILLLNAGLTVEAMKPCSHNDLWEPFMQYLFEEVINQTGVPIIFLGKEAQKLQKYTAPFSWIFNLSHPASASYNGGEWDSQGVFKAIDKILWDRNKDRISWFDSSEQIPF